MSKTPHTESQDSRSDTPKQAVALQYQDIDELPVLLARGFGELASRIQDIAEENEIPVQENSSALESLSSLRVGQQIEEESFDVIAEVISFLYHVDKEWREKHDFLGPVLE